MTISEIASLFGRIELRLIQSLKRNLGRHKAWEQEEGFDWPAWQAVKLQNVRNFCKENQRILGEYSGVIDQETADLLQEQFEEGKSQVDAEIEELGIPQQPMVENFFGVNDKKLKALIQDIQAVEKTAESAALRMTDDVYRRTILGAETAISVGATTIPQAVDMAVKDFLEKGIDCIQYKNGRRVNIATYAEMALRTASTRAYLQGEAKRRKEYGIDTVLVSQYGACSETCLPWQGRVYIDDVWGEFSGEISGDRGQSVSGSWHPLLSKAIQGGLFHPNCRHTLSTWYEGVSKLPPPLDAEKVRKTASLEAQQRKLECQVRKWKRLSEGTQDPITAAAYSRKVKDSQKELREFIRKHSDVLRRDYWRESIQGHSLYAVGAKPIPITDEAISAVGVVESSFFDGDRLQNLHRDLLRQAQGYPLDAEVQRSYDMNGSLLLERMGEGGTVKLKRLYQPFFVMHNHPDANTFSMGDMKALALVPDLMGISAVGNNGSVYLMEKTLVFQPEQFLEACMEWEDAFRRKPKTVQSAVDEIEKFISEGEKYGLRFVSSVR